MTTIKKVMILDRIKLPLELVDIVRDYAFVHIETKRLEQKKRKDEVVLKNITGDYFNSYLVIPKHVTGVTYNNNRYHFKHELGGLPFIGALTMHTSDGIVRKRIATCLFCGNYTKCNIMRTRTVVIDKIKCKCSDGYYEKKHPNREYLGYIMVCEKRKCDSGYYYHKRSWYTRLFYED
jgi:hypothetical protein